MMTKWNLNDVLFIGLKILKVCCLVGARSKIFEQTIIILEKKIYMKGFYRKQQWVLDSFLASLSLSLSLFVALFNDPVI